jgi:hypothetical protein
MNRLLEAHQGVPRQGIFFLKEMESNNFRI